MGSNEITRKVSKGKDTLLIENENELYNDLMLSNKKYNSNSLFSNAKISKAPRSAAPVRLKTVKEVSESITSDASDEPSPFDFCVNSEKRMLQQEYENAVFRGLFV